MSNLTSVIIQEFWLAGVVLMVLGTYRAIVADHFFLTKALLFVQVVNLFLFGIDIFSWSLAQTVSAAVLGFCLITLLTQAYRALQKAFLLRSSSSLSWDHLNVMLEWRLAEEFNQRGLTENATREAINDLSRASGFKRNKEIISEVEIEMLQKRVRAKKGILDHDKLNWRKEFYPLIANDEKVLSEIRQARLQLTQVAIWILVGLLFILIGRCL